MISPINLAWKTPLYSRNYNRVLASQWIRIFQLRPYLHKLGFNTSIGGDFSKAHVVVFSRAQREEDASLARKLRANGVLVVLDLVVNYLEVSNSPAGPVIDHKKVRETQNMIREVDVIICASQEISDQARKLHSTVYYLPDSLDLKHFKPRKNLEFGRFANLRLHWSGHESKLVELKPVLPFIRQNNLRLDVVTNRPTKSAHFLKAHGVSGSSHIWTHRLFPNLISMSDVALSYRSLDLYNKGHSSFKILAPMSQGLPVLASPLRSYKEALSGGGGQILESDEQWADTLSDLAAGRVAIDEMSKRAMTSASKFSSEKMARELASIIQANIGLNQ